MLSLLYTLNLLDFSLRSIPSPVSKQRGEGAKGLSQLRRLQNSPFLLQQKWLEQLRRPPVVAEGDTPAHPIKPGAVASLQEDTLTAQAAFAKIDIRSKPISLSVE